jgi:hypothetical protein
MKFTFFSKVGKSLALAQRCEAEGNTVNFYCELKGVGDGYVHTVHVPVVEPDTVLVFDDCRHGGRADEYRSSGYAVIGASTFGNNLAVNPQYNTTVSQIVGDYEMPANTYIEGWFNGDDWIMGLTSLCVYDTHHLAGDLGRETGYESGTMCFWKRLRPEMFRQTIGRLSSLLRRIAFVGPIRYNGRLLTGFTWNNVHVPRETLGIDTGKLLADTSRKTIKRVKTGYDYVTVIRVTVPPYPYGNFGLQSHDVGCPVTFGLSPLSVGIEADRLKAYGTTVGCSVGTGNSAAQSASEAKVKGGKAWVKEKQYRVDAGLRAERTIPVILRKDTRCQTGTNMNVLYGPQ